MATLSEILPKNLKPMGSNAYVISKHFTLPHKVRTLSDYGWLWPDKWGGDIESAIVVPEETRIPRPDDRTILLVRVGLSTDLDLPYFRQCVVPKQLMAPLATVAIYHDNLWGVTNCGLKIPQLGSWHREFIMEYLTIENERFLLINGWPYNKGFLHLCRPK